jgi:predicted ribosome quality control (RQC) complex YloA/Tae2 family protein
MRVMSNLEYAAVVRELQPLVGRRFGRIRRLPQGWYRLKLGDAEIVIEPGVRLHRTKYVEEAETPDKLVQKAEAELDNSKLIAIRQVNGDRIIEFEFDKGRLVFEMFGKGNCVLVQDGKTVAAMKEDSWADREIRRGKEYHSPKSNVASSFRDALTDKYVIIALLKLPLGKEYALEILERCGVGEKTPGIELTGKQMDCIEDEIAEVVAVCKPHVFYKDGKPVDFGLLHFSKYRDFETKDFTALGEALDEYYWNADREAPNPALERLERRLAEQEGRRAELEKEEAENKAAGDYIYANYGDIEKTLKEARSVPLEELEQRLGRLKAKVNKKEKSLEIEI